MLSLRTLSAPLLSLVHPLLPLPSLPHQMKAAEESLKVQNRHKQRMQQSNAASEVRWHGYTHMCTCNIRTHTHIYSQTTPPAPQVVNHAIGEVLSEARDRNRRLDQTVFEMGYSRRPTVAQWLEQKKMQKQRELQEDMIQWDR